VNVERSRALAQKVLRDEPVKWMHVQAVALVAAAVAEPLGVDKELLVSAAYLHDVGYAAELRRTGFHPLDGARFLVVAGVPMDVATLVGNHSCAIVEAGIRGLANELCAEFPVRDELAADALCYVDMTCGPTGDTVTVDERLREIRRRYGPGHVVTCFIEAAEPQLVATVRRVEKSLADVQSK
jgi:putative nucleotidyltransferase with HDIG domain